MEFLRMRHVAAPSVAPVRDVTSYIVVDDFGKSGRAFRETDVAEADEEATVDALLSGQYERPIQIVAFNLEEAGCATCRKTSLAAPSRRRRRPARRSLAPRSGSMSNIPAKTFRGR